ncbi:MAG: ATP-binding protein, partial [Chloroflexota bacterium]|nr:ATP-binding protein [Chloroflexota bacterium]
LAPSVRWLAKRQMETYGLQILTAVDGLEDIRLAPHMELALFRVAQEALTNVAKHANASLVRIELSLHGQQVRLAVEDNGVGFDPAQVPDERLGLFGMEERIALLGGKLRIDSRPGHGTRLIVTAEAALAG